MIRPAPFPIAVDQLTPGLLSEALGYEVADFSARRIGADRGMLGVIHVLDLEFEGVAGPAQVVAKFAALRPASLASALRGGTHQRELLCYDLLLAETPVNAPLMYAGWYDEQTAHFLLLQEAVTADASVDQIAGIDVERARVVLRQTARLHAHWWGGQRLHRLAWLPRLDAPGRLANLGALAVAGWQPLCELLGDDLDDSEVALGDDLPAHLERMLRDVAAHPSTLIHSDLRADNLLFNLDGDDVVIVDWQGAGIGPPGFDLAYFMSQSLSVETRRAHEDDLIDFYIDELSRAGCALTKEEVLAGYADSMLYGLVIACALPLVSDPGEQRVKELASACARRAIEGLRDHGRLWNPTRGTT